MLSTGISDKCIYFLNAQYTYLPSQILALRRLIEGIKDKNLLAIIIFIDFKKAFDTIHRSKILRAYGIPDAQHSLIK